MRNCVVTVTGTACALAQAMTSGLAFPGSGAPSPSEVGSRSGVTTGAFSKAIERMRAGPLKDQLRAAMRKGFA